MPDILFGKGAYRRDKGELPEFKLVNLWPEETPSAESGVVLQSVPGFVEHSTVGVGPIESLFQQPGTFGGAVFTISGGNLYRDLTLLGAIPGTGPVSWAANSDEVVVTRGGAAYSYNGINLAAIAMPEGFDVTAVEYGAGLFIYLAAGTHRWYWSDPLDGRSIDALSFASAEAEPDDLRDVRIIGDSMFLAGSSSLEVWIKTGDPLAPFTPITARTANRGVIATGCMEEMDNTLYFVGDDAVVYRMADVPQRVSNHGIEERIAKSATRSAFKFFTEGHLPFCIRLDNGTWGIDVTTGQWFELASLSRPNWRGRCAVNAGGLVLIGDDSTGKVWTFGGWEHAGLPVPRLFTGAFPIKGGATPIDSICVDANTGASDQDVMTLAPRLELRTSRDGGRLWGDWRPASLGKPGETRQQARWRRLGYFDAPGGVVEFRLLDPAPLRVSAVRVNESAAGRGR